MEHRVARRRVPDGLWRLPEGVRYGAPMDVDAALEEMSEFADLVSARLANGSSLLRSAWTTYSNEAAWGRQYLDAELQRLTPGARILEVGAGTFALSGQLAREGFDVTGLEPVGLGFATMEGLGRLVGAAFDEQGVGYGRLPLMAEDLTDIEEYDFAFSINVLEHVRDVRPS